MENLTEIPVDKRTRDGEARTSEVIEEKRFWIAKISWPAIFSGVLVTIVSQILLSLLGIGIGLGAIHPFNSNETMQTVSSATIAWWSITMLVSLFLGGWTTGKMYIPKFKGELTMHGLLTWSTFTVFSFIMLATSFGMLISGTGNLVGTALSVAASANKDQIDISSLTNDARNAVLQSRGNANMSGATTVSQQENETGNPNASNNMNNAGVTNANMTSANMTNKNMTDGSQLLFVNSVETFFKGGDIGNPANKEALVNSLVTQTGMSRDEANAKVNQWINSYNDLKAKARVNADQAAKVVSTASIISFFALLIGALVTIWGARIAQRKNLVLVRK